MTAAVVAEVVGGRTRCTTLRSAPPISLRETPDGLFLVASGAGPLGGDHLSLDLEVRAGATLVVRSAAASMVLPGPTGTRSSLVVRARVAGSLTWAPETTLLVEGCDHHAVTEIDLVDEGTIDWRETIVLGRHDQPSGSMLQRLQVDRNGHPLLRTEVPLGPRWVGAEGPAGTDGARVVGSVLLVGGDEPEAPGHGATLALAPDAWLVTHLESRATGNGHLLIPSQALC